MTEPSSGGVGAAFKPSYDASEREGHSWIPPVDLQGHHRETLFALTLYSLRNSTRNDVFSIWTHSPHYFIKRRLQENRGKAAGGPGKRLSIASVVSSASAFGFASGKIGSNRHPIDAHNPISETKVGLRRPKGLVLPMNGLCRAARYS